MIKFLLSAGTAGLILVGATGIAQGPSDPIAGAWDVAIGSPTVSRRGALQVDRTGTKVAGHLQWNKTTVQIPINGSTDGSALRFVILYYKGSGESRTTEQMIFEATKQPDGSLRGSFQLSATAAKEELVCRRPLNK